MLAVVVAHGDHQVGKPLEGHVEAQQPHRSAARASRHCRLRRHRVRLCHSVRAVDVRTRAACQLFLRQLLRLFLLLRRWRR